MTTLQEAAQMALDALDSDNPDIQLRAATHLRAALAQPEQELVAHVCRFDKNGRPDIAWDNCRDMKIGTKLYAAPLQREWQPLTDEEIEDACWTEVDQRLRSFARVIEAKLREKNS
jgi:hypothetical protein